jgi:hypothetical protein
MCGSSYVLGGNGSQTPRTLVGVSLFCIVIMPGFMRQIDASPLKSFCS